jgi:hypothetical protein
LIPSIAHFVWYGTKLPYLHALAIRSAATHGGFDSVRLHHTDPLDELPHVRDLHDVPNFELVLLDDRALCEAASGPALADLVGELKSPVARSNLVRTALVYRDGGVYLDMDTLTIRPFDDVRSRAPGFLGEELIVFPEEVVASWDPRVNAEAYFKTAVRDVLRRLPHGYRYFPRIERHYHRAVNGAILGGVPGHAFCAEYLTAMTCTRSLRRSSTLCRRRSVRTGFASTGTESIRWRRSTRRRAACIGTHRYAPRRS